MFIFFFSFEGENELNIQNSTIHELNDKITFITKKFKQIEKEYKQENESLISIIKNLEYKITSEIELKENRKKDEILNSKRQNIIYEEKALEIEKKFKDLTIRLENELRNKSKIEEELNKQKQ